MTDSGKLLAIDPGKSTGWAVFTVGDLNPIHRGISRSVDEFLDFLVRLGKASSLSTVVYESYRVRPYTNHNGSEVEAAQVVGAIKLFGKYTDVKIVSQQSSVLPMAAMWCPIKMPSNHNFSHDVSAIHHGVYYQVTKKYAKIPEGSPGRPPGKMPFGDKL